MSVIIPAYNAASFITETLESVFAQTFKSFEVIIINDGSPDTEEFERVLQTYMSRVAYIRQENRGPSAARNVGILRASGEYLAFLDADDLWLPEYLNEQMKLFEQMPSLDLVYSDVLICYASMADGVPHSQDSPSNGPVTFESLLTEKCQISTSAAIVRKQAVQGAGLFDEQLWRSEDYDLWLRLAHWGARMAYQQKILAVAHMHLDSLGAQTAKILESMARVLTKLETELTVTPKRRALLQREKARARANLDLERGKVCLQQGRFDEARERLSNANAFLRRRKLTLMLLALRLSPKLAELVSRMWAVLAVGLWRLRNHKRRNWPISWAARG